MATEIPKVVRERIRKYVYVRLDGENYLMASRTANARLLENLCSDPEVGGVICQYYPKERVRTYIKDAIFNRYAKEHKIGMRPKAEKIEAFCRECYHVSDFKPLDPGVKGVVLLKSVASPIYAVVVEGTFLKWETALRKGLLYVAGHPFGVNEQNTVHIVLSLFMSGVSQTPVEIKQFRRALSRADAIPYCWGGSV